MSTAKQLTYAQQSATTIITVAFQQHSISALRLCVHADGQWPWKWMEHVLSRWTSAPTQLTTMDHQQKYVAYIKPVTTRKRFAIHVYLDLLTEGTDRQLSHQWSSSL